MGQPAARIGDLAGHGGTIIFGTPTVLINGMPAARVGDPFVCPGFDGLKPHVMGNIVMGSTSVIIAGAFAARIGDTTGCGVAGVSGSSMPAVMGPPPVSVEVPGALPTIESVGLGTKNAGLLYGKQSGYTNETGIGREVQGSLEHFEGETEIDGNTFEGSMDVMGGKGKAQTHLDGYPGGGGSLEVSALSVEGKAKLADGRSLQASGGLFNASVKSDFLAGTDPDGRRTGFALGASIGASVAEGEVTATSKTYSLLGYNVKVARTVGGGVLAVGGGAAIGGYHDSEDNRVHIMGMIDIEAFFKGKLGLDISFGKDEPPAPPLPPPISTPGIGIPMTPGSVIMGSPTVLIG